MKTRRGPLSDATYALRYFNPLRRRAINAAEEYGYCPWCEAKPGEPCQTPSHKWRMPHRARNILIPKELNRLIEALEMPPDCRELSMAEWDKIDRAVEEYWKTK